MKTLPVPCRIYRSAKRDELFLYVKQKQKLSELPAALMESLGDLEHALDILLVEGKRLARADATEVLKCLHTQGYYLQMPPTPDQSVEALIQQLQAAKKD